MAANRKLKQQGSHPEAPKRKTGVNSTATESKVPSSDEDMNDDQDMKSMMKTMMGMMKDVTKDLSDVKERVTESMTTASRAVDTANQVASAVSELSTSMKKDIAHIDTRVTKLAADSAVTKAQVASLQSDVEKIMGKGHGQTDGGGGKVEAGGGKGGGKVAGKGGGKDAGKDAKRREERKRTIFFSNFADETQEDDIISTINEQLAGGKDGI